MTLGTDQAAGPTPDPLPGLPPGTPSDPSGEMVDLDALYQQSSIGQTQPHFSNARSIRNAPDRARLRHANRLFERRGTRISRDELAAISAEDIRASRVFAP